MKHLYSIFYFLVLVNLSFYSQGSPNSFKYQAIARDVNGNPIVSSNISLEIAIKSSSCNGQIIYQEQFFVTTNQYGLVSLSIGNGTVVSGEILQESDSTLTLDTRIGKLVLKRLDS